MFLATNRFAFVLLSFAASALSAAPSFRVCADPNNLPYSNQQQQGFENKLADLIASDFGEEVTYTWYPQRSKFFRRTLQSGVCDVVMGVPLGLEEATTTRPYYRSTYVFVSRADRKLHISSFDDPRLRGIRIGVHVLGQGDDSLPPVHALLSRGIVRNLVGYSIFGNLAEISPEEDLIQAVSNKDVDIAVAWGPLAGYSARHSTVALDLAPINGDPTNPSLPFSFDIGIGIRPNQQELKRRLDAELEKRKPEIQDLLRSYGVPQLDQVTSHTPEE